MLAWDITICRRIFEISDEDGERKRYAEIGLPTLSKPQQKRARAHLFRDSYTEKWPYIVPSECEDYTFCRVCDNSLSIAKQRITEGMMSVTVLTSHGHIAELNKP